MKKIFDKKNKVGGYKGGNKFPGGGRPRHDARSGGTRPTLYRATCDQCRSACEVPFMPTGQKPVYCRNCFRSSDHEPSVSRPAQRPSFFDKKPSFHSAPSSHSTNNNEVVKQLKALNAKMDQLLEALSGFDVSVQEMDPDTEELDEDVNFSDAA